MQRPTQVARIASALEAMANAIDRVASRMDMPSGCTDRMSAKAAPEGQGLGAMNAPADGLVAPPTVNVNGGDYSPRQARELAMDLLAWANEVEAEE